MVWENMADGAIRSRGKNDLLEDQVVAKCRGTQGTMLEFYVLARECDGDEKCIEFQLSVNPLQNWQEQQGCDGNYSVPFLLVVDWAAHDNVFH